MPTLGEITLNISLILYVLLYLPQLIHNTIHKKLAHMSLGFHALLFIAATADLYYGFGRITQWQYQCVNIIMFSCLLFQHIHLFFYAHKIKNGLFYLILLSCIIVFILIPLPLALHSKQNQIFIGMGWIARICYWLYTLPQLRKNKQQRNAQALSPFFIGLAVLTALCDCISAWMFSWGSPSLYGAPLSIGLHVALLTQWFRFKKTTSHPLKTAPILT